MAPRQSDPTAAAGCAIDRALATVPRTDHPVAINSHTDACVDRICRCESVMQSEIEYATQSAADIVHEGFGQVAGG